MWLGRNLPRRTGQSLVRSATSLLSRRKQSDLIRSIRVNQSVARDLPLDAPELDAAVSQVLYKAGTGYYELYHRLGQGQQAVQESVHFSSKLDHYIAKATSRGQGVLVVSPHVGNFDLAMLVFAARQYPIQIISYTLPPGGYELQNEIRAAAGYKITPAGPAAARSALQRLKQGGIVATGIDRPLPTVTQPVRFFGQPALLPTGHIRLAMSTGAILLVLHLEPEENGRYRAEISDPVEMVNSGNRKRDTQENAEQVLTLVEGYIRATPEEWMMFHPVWPQLLEQF